MDRSNHAPCVIHFIYCCGALIFNDMPSKEYRILVNGKVVMRNWTSRQHIVWVDVYLDRGVEFTEEIVDLRQCTTMVWLCSRAVNREQNFQILQNYERIEKYSRNH